MRILLIRHGRSAHPRSPGLLDRAGVEDWLQKYDAAGLMPDEPPPRRVVEEVSRADLVVASDMPRAVASAEMLCPGHPVVHSPLFREIPLPIPNLGPVRAPLEIWGLLIHLQWLLDARRGRHPGTDARRQLRAASDWCRSTMRQHDGGATIAVVTHGVVRRLLVNELVTRGWARGEWRRSYAHWSMWSVRAKAK